MRKYTVICLLYFCVINPIVAEEATYMPSQLYLIEDGAAKDITMEILTHKRSLAGMRKITVTGYVLFPGVYYTKSPVGLVELIELTQSVESPNGSFSGQFIYVVESSDNEQVLKFDIREARKLAEHDAKHQPMLEGGEIIYRSGVRF